MAAATGCDNNTCVARCYRSFAAARVTNATYIRAVTHASIYARGRGMVRRRCDLLYPILYNYRIRFPDQSKLPSHLIRLASSRNKLCDIINNEIRISQNLIRSTEA